MIRVRVAAKCNLSLRIVGNCEDGYHRLEMCNASVGIWDEILVRPPEGRLGAGAEPVIVCRMGGRLQDKKNSAYRAAELYCRTYGLSSAGIEIVKGIPFCAGLGGSSADAAGVLRALNGSCGLASEEELRQLALACGADVPFMLSGGFARVMGKGEIVERFCPKKNCALVILKSGNVLTSAAYAAYDSRPPALDIDTDRVVRAVCEGKWSALARCAGNDLAPGAVRMCEAVGRNLNLLRQYGALYAEMTGSGSAVFGVFESLSRAEEVARACKGRAEFVCACMTLSAGIEQIAETL